MGGKNAISVMLRADLFCYHCCCPLVHLEVPPSDHFYPMITQFCTPDGSGLYQDYPMPLYKAQ